MLLQAVNFTGYHMIRRTLLQCCQLVVPKRKPPKRKKEITPKKPLGVICHTVSELTVLIKGIFNSEQEKIYYNRKFNQHRISFFLHCKVFPKISLMAYKEFSKKYYMYCECKIEEFIISLTKICVSLQPVQIPINHINY